jgi:hypothetical protein
MTAPAFTPGPWELRPHAKLGGTQMYWVNDVTSVGTQVEADARLIAAAPGLYADAEFLCARIRELEGEMRDDDEFSRQYFGHILPAVARMESALAEARGETA